mmetsp:Transcript_5324/g.15266  ORF Transcript_5324/g.15266 Transcript_5324/m.15266 type:complete len:336 (+) Transcript_5324:240-1247(+)|eukprot:CAMPEP_0206136560 /NCGR_PEP_ID=MMETSP1473-20131121/1802_1 /ASSEMBLY_ACC=CAM_ASM_001109 /TAXON_ID=1461547 /ORGANISM="Stichococcus sp, Strain RCC1054" /LENGTH=335 /DNA_ID=CAMNT_0053529197 /DNA_START=229 /DNA_END=1236 /DNA_ORIENTATION=-
MYELWGLAHAPSPSADPGPNNISLPAVGFGAGLIFINAAISLWLSLGLEVQLVIAAARCMLQLTVLGYILVPIFTTPHWYVVILYALLMAAVGAYEASSRPAYKFKGLFAQVLSCTTLATSIFTAYALLVLVRTDPWWEPQYLITMLGMLLGNCISGMSVGLSALLEDVTTGKDKIELLLSLGASRWEAGQETIARCIKLALTPILNQMNVVGIVSIPGMMTGQILGGTDPAQAARYQMLIMFLISASTGSGVVLAVGVAFCTICDSDHRLRPERLTPQAKGEKIEHRVHNWVTKGTKVVKTTWTKVRGHQPVDNDDEPLLVPPSHSSSQQSLPA